MRPIDFPGVMNALAANPFDDQAIVFPQLQSRLAHDHSYERRVTTSEVYSAVTSRPVGYFRRSSRQVTVNPLAVVVPAISLTMVS